VMWICFFFTLFFYLVWWNGKFGFFVYFLCDLEWLVVSECVRLAVWKILFHGHLFTTSLFFLLGH